MSSYSRILDGLLEYRLDIFVGILSLTGIFGFVCFTWIVSEPWWVGPHCFWQSVFSVPASIVILNDRLSAIQDKRNQIRKEEAARKLVRDVMVLEKVEDVRVNNKEV